MIPFQTASKATQPVKYHSGRFDAAKDTWTNE